MIFIIEKIDNTVTLDALLQKLIYLCIDLRERELFAAALIQNTHKQDTHRFKESGFFTLVFLSESDGVPGNRLAGDGGLHHRSQQGRHPGDLQGRHRDQSITQQTQQRL